MKYAWIILFCIFLNAVSPKCQPDSKFKVNDDLDFGSNLTVELTEESQKKLQMFIKNKLVENRQIPETATVNIEAICLDKNNRDLFSGQRYIVKSLASWTAFFPHKCKVGLYILKMNKHNDYFFTQLFDSNLVEAKVDLPR